MVSMSAVREVMSHAEAGSSAETNLPRQLKMSYWPVIFPLPMEVPSPARKAPRQDFIPADFKAMKQ